MVEVKHKVGVGWRPEIRKTKAMNSAAPNFIHAIDAAHLVQTVNTAAQFFKIDDILTVHDCYACHAADADDLHQAIRKSLGAIHFIGKPLEGLRRQNVGEGESPALPPCGDLSKKIIPISKSPYSFD